MAAISSVRVTGTITGMAASSDDIDTGALTNSDAPKGRTTQRINAAFAQVAIPALDGTAVIKGVIIIPLNGGGTITLKGVTGDTGFPIHSTEPTGPIRLPSITAASFGLLTTTDVTFQFIWL